MEAVPVITPEQLSVVVGGVTVTEHDPVTVAKVGTTGAILSVTFTVKLQVLVFADASVAV